MPISTAFIDAEIAQIEARLLADDYSIESAGSDGTTAKRFSLEADRKRLMHLHTLKDRLSGNSPMRVGTKVTGLGR